MQLVPVSFNTLKNRETAGNSPAFSHDKGCFKNNYTFKDRAIIAATSALGVAAGCAVLAKCAKYSLKPEKMFSNIKKSYLANVRFHDKEVIIIGAGSCLGGLAGGYIVDKNSQNRKLKNREAIMQIGNISIPILTVETFARIGEKFGKVPKSLAAIAGIFAGVYLANILMNTLSNALFKNHKGIRGVEATDFSAHLDDGVFAAQIISESKLIYYISRLIPPALMIAGNKVGNKTVKQD